MPKKLSIDIIIERLKKVTNNQLKLDVTTYKNTYTKCKFIDEDYGEWWTIPRDILNKGCQHPKRKNNDIKKILTIPVDIIQKRIYEVYNDLIILDESTYINTKTKAKFIDKDYGEWWTTIHNLLCKIQYHPERAKINRIKTTLERYGVEHNMQNKVLAQNNAKAQNNSYILYHWKTKEEIIAVGSYERKVVEYLNENKVEYLWQPKVFITSFLTPTGKFSTYTPDLYLSDLNLWVEIKGYFRKDAKEKWEWFCKQHPNSELWEKKKLKEMKIL